MEREEFKILVKGMKAVYAQPTFIPDQDAFNIWFGMLQDIPYDVATNAVQKYMMTKTFPPTIADIRSIASQTVSAPIEDWGVGWEQVTRNIGRYGMCTYDPDRLEECMNSFDPVTRKVVERLGWKDLCMSENIMADRANFRMIYEQVAERQKKENQISIGVKREAERLSTNQVLMIEGECK
jgi:hypothetical protein